MGYIDHAVPSYASSELKTAFMHTLDTGVDYATDSALIEDERAQSIKNMWLENGILTSVPPFSPLSAVDNFPVGEIHSYFNFDECLFFHIGKCLYGLSDGNLTLLSDSFPDYDSIPVEFVGKLYFYCNSHIFSVDRNQLVKEEFPFAPLYRYSCSSNSDVGNYSQDFKPNILAPYISMTYDSENRVNGSWGYKFPRDFDSSRPFQVYFCDRLLTEDEYTVYDDKFDLIDLEQEEENSVKLCYYSTNAELDLSAVLSNCKKGISFGGGTLEGTRVILAGNSEYPGKYFFSELANPLCFYENSGGTLGSGSQDITAFSKQYGYLLIFTADTVSRMTYVYTQDYGGYFSVSTIHESIGCDIPESIALADNRTVFANTYGGIYLVDSTDIFDRLNIVPISRNITDLSRNRGYFSVPATELKKASGCVYERKYLLSAGNKIFVWDFGACGYTSSSDYVKSAKKLIWFELDSAQEKKIFTSGTFLYCTYLSEAGYNTFCSLSKNSEKNSDTGDEYGFHSKNMDLSYPHIKKCVDAISFECRIPEETEVTLNSYADGILYSTIKTKLIPGKDGCAVFAASLPHHILRRFAFEVKCKDSGTGIFNIRIDYRILKRNLSR